MRRDTIPGSINHCPQAAAIKQRRRILKIKNYKFQGRRQTNPRGRKRLQLPTNCYSILIFNRHQ
jgi:hypothetical protein